ncbi:hypothetical protein HWV62_16194 [Athelia sp. TMB]|nr:hypothetical protein HWV62_16194 [Athelia sp. TMB]
MLPVFICSLLYGAFFASHIIAAPVASSPSSFAQRNTESSTYWLDNIQHNGASPYNGNTTFAIYRNVINYGATGDGSTDDTAAIQAALTDGDGCANSACSGSTIYPKVVFFPPGSYLVSRTLQISMYTQIIGDPTDTPTIFPASTFGANYVLDGFPNTNGAYWNGGNSPDNFYKSIRNLNIDTSKVAPNINVKCLNWAVAQATSLRYMTFTMVQNGVHQGIDMQGTSVAANKDSNGGSGTFMGDLTFVNGNIGLTVSNQQFHFRNLNFKYVTTAIVTEHLFVGVFQDITFLDCGTGIQGLPSGHSGFYSISLIDSTATGLQNVIVAPVQTTTDIRPVVIDNLVATDVINIIQDSSGAVVLAGNTGGTVDVSAYVRGVVYNDQSDQTYTQGEYISAVQKPSAMLTGGKWYTKAKPVYSTLASASVVNVKSHGARGDGSTDDTAALQAILTENAGTGHMIYFPYGIYVVSDTLYVPPNSILQGEAWSSIRAVSGSTWSSETNPQAVLQIGRAGDRGTFSMADMVVEPGNVYPGAKLIEINMAGNPGDVGIWDCVIRTGGTASAGNQASLCTTAGAECKSAWGALHITSSASAYIENVWGWLADHGIDDTAGANAVSIQMGRGALIESTSPSFFVGVAMEHCTFYSIHTYDAENLFLGLIQDETPYWQGDNAASSEWKPNAVYHDPDFSNCATADVNCRQAFGLNFDGGSNIFSYGSGVWTFHPTQTNDVWISDDPANLYIFNPNNGGSGGGWTNIISVSGGGSVTDAENPGTWSPGGVIGAYLAFA